MLATEFDQSVNERGIEILDDVYMSLVLSRTNTPLVHIHLIIFARHVEPRKRDVMRKEQIRALTRQT